MVRITLPYVQSFFELRSNPYLCSKCKCKPQANQTPLGLKAQSDTSTTKPAAPLLPRPSEAQVKASSTITEPESLLILPFRAGIPSQG